MITISLIIIFSDSLSSGGGQIVIFSDSISSGDGHKTTLTFRGHLSGGTNKNIIFSDKNCLSQTY